VERRQTPTAARVRVPDVECRVCVDEPQNGSHDFANRARFGAEIVLDAARNPPPRRLLKDDEPKPFDLHAEWWSKSGDSQLKR